MTNSLLCELLIGMMVALGGVALVDQSPAELEGSLVAQTKAHPEDPMPFARLGLLHAKRGEYADAIALYERAMALQPALPGLRLNLGLAYFKSGDYKNAVGTLTPLDTRTGSTAETQRVAVLVGMSHYGLSEYAAAIPYLQRGRDSDPTNLSLLLTLAHACLLSKQYDCVLDSYHRMVALNAESAEVDMLVGEALDEQHDTPGAIKEFRAAVKANPKEPNAHFGLGYMLWTQMQYEDAANEFRAEMANVPEHVRAELYLGDVKLQMNQFDEALPLLEKAVASDPKSAMAHLDLGIIYEQQKQNEKAITEFKVAVELKPEDVNAHMKLARLYKSMGQVTEAKKEFDTASRLTKARNDSLVEIMQKDVEDDRKKSE